MMDRDALTFRNREQELRQFTGRALTLWVLLALAILLLVLRLFQLQVLEHDRHAARSEKNRIEVQPLAPPRGEIYDRKGRLIAGNLPVFSLMVVEERVEDLEATLALLEALIGLTVEEREAFQGRLARRRHEAVGRAFGASGAPSEAGRNRRLCPVFCSQARRPCYGVSSTRARRTWTRAP